MVGAEVQSSQGPALAGVILLYSWTRHFTLTVPLSTLVYKWVPANLMLGVNLRNGETCVKIFWRHCTFTSRTSLFNLLNNSCDVVSMSVVTSSSNLPTFQASHSSSHSLVIVQTCSRYSKSFSNPCRSFEGGCSILKMFNPRLSFVSWDLRFVTCSW